jgi:hypothetical protein
LGVSTHKKVLVSRFDRDTLSGFVNPQGYQLADGLELMTQAGSVSIIPYMEVKLVCFVRDFQQGEPRKELRLFTTRPKRKVFGCACISAMATQWTEYYRTTSCNWIRTVFRWFHPTPASKTSASSFRKRLCRGFKCWAWWEPRCGIRASPK